MKNLKNITAVVTIASLISGCAASHKSFISKSGGFSDTKICRNYVNDYAEARALSSSNTPSAAEASSPMLNDDMPLKPAVDALEVAEVEQKAVKPDEVKELYLVKLVEEVQVRRLTLQKCQQLVKEEDNKIAAGIIIGAAVATVIAVGVSGNGGNGGSGTYGGYAWDGFRDQYGNIVWRCRDKTNGQFAYDFNCGGMAKVDNTWPNW